MDLFILKQSLENSSKWFAKIILILWKVLKNSVLFHFKITTVNQNSMYAYVKKVQSVLFVACDKLQKKKHRMHRMQFYILLFNATHALLEKVSSFLNLGMTNYILLWKPFTLYYKNINKNIFHSKVYSTNLRRKYIRIHFLN